MEFNRRDILISPLIAQFRLSICDFIIRASILHYLKLSRVRVRCEQIDLPQFRLHCDKFNHFAEVRESQTQKAQAKCRKIEIRRCCWATVQSRSNWTQIRSIRSKMQSVIFSCPNLLIVNCRRAAHGMYVFVFVKLSRNRISFSSSFSLSFEQKSCSIHSVSNFKSDTNQFYT